MNRWHVYEWLKQSFMFSGNVPKHDDVYLQFRGMDRKEIEEGILEFEVMANVRVNTEHKTKWGKWKVQKKRRAGA